ncbi:hypothetical protein FXO38_32263 [Capsicum annuum]|nr:hypothetical protein FXO38_32263 [Capsicum annuum]
MSKPPGTYYPNIIREFFANYLALVEKGCPKGTRILDLPNREAVPIREVTIDISTRTLNRMLLGPDYEAPTAISKLRYRLKTTSSQRPWLSRLLTDDGNPSWVHNTKDRLLNHPYFWAKFW